MGLSGSRSLPANSVCLTALCGAGLLAAMCQSESILTCFG